METVRLTTAAALVRYLIAQRIELDGAEAPLFPGVFAIFGHGNVTSLGLALQEAQDELPTWRGQNEQGMALAAVAFAVYGTEGALAWNLERMNELELYLAGTEPHTGYTRVFGGDRFEPHGVFAPGAANGIGFEDLIAIEDRAFLRALAEGRPYEPGFDDALRAACTATAESGTWHDVVPLGEG